MNDHLRLDFDGPLATLTIDRPTKRNAMSLQMWSALPQLMSLVADSDARALIVRGGEHFSAGADISEFQTLRADAQSAAIYGDAVHAGERAIASLAKPTIAAINGYCIGGGCEVALACDVRIAANDAVFGITPAKLGIVYNFTSTRQLVQAVGPAWAKQILFSGDFLDAATALRIGLVNEIHEPGDVVERVGELARTIAGRAQVSVRGAKTIINALQDGQVDEGPGIEVLYDDALHSTDYAEGVAAFLAKRTPRF